MLVMSVTGSNLKYAKRNQVCNWFISATQYVSWLPRFSVAVTRLTGRQPVQLNSMVSVLLSITMEFKIFLNFLKLISNNK